MRSNKEIKQAETKALHNMFKEKKGHDLEFYLKEFNNILKIGD